MTGAWQDFSDAPDQAQAKPEERLTAEDIKAAERCTADHVLLDSGAGTGEVFDWKLIKNMKRLILELMILLIFIP